MSQDDKDFEEIYQSLTPGLVIAACSPESGHVAQMLRSFCFSLKGAAIRCGSDEKDFEEIYQSLTPGLVIAACSPESGHVAQMLRSFCFSLKGAAIRCGSDVML